ncbi:MAG: hypothetical protein J2O38_06425, partial [Acidimicrobiales bacterium]|nr:hypothetical protein [Acidimicrobiales bacterium]
MPTQEESAALAAEGWWWLNLETGAALRAKETMGPALQVKEGEWQLIHMSGGMPGPGLPRVIGYGSLEELRDMVRRWLGDDLYVEETLLEGPAARGGGVSAEPTVSMIEEPPPLPWSTTLPKTLAEARSLGERVPVGVEKPVSYKVFLQYLIGDWVLCTPDALNQSPEFKDALGEWGLVIDPDGRWAALYETDGELHRSTGWGTEGSWELLDTRGMNPSATFQLNLTVDGGG